MLYLRDWNYSLFMSRQSKLNSKRNIVRTTPRTVLHLPTHHFWTKFQFSKSSPGDNGTGEWGEWHHQMLTLLPSLPSSSLELSLFGTIFYPNSAMTYFWVAHPYLALVWLKRNIWRFCAGILLWGLLVLQFYTPRPKPLTKEYQPRHSPTDHDIRSQENPEKNEKQGPGHR